MKGAYLPTIGPERWPVKQRPEQKIDAAVALMMAVGRAMAEDDGQGDLEDFLRDPVIA